MKVFFCVVVCVLIVSRRIASSTSVSPAPNISFLTSAFSTPNYTTTTTPSPVLNISCSDPQPPIILSIIVGKTFANTTWNMTQTDSECITKQLDVFCFASKDENMHGWVKNSSFSNVTLWGSEMADVNIENLSEFTNYTCNVTLKYHSDDSRIIQSTAQISFQTDEEVPSEPLDLTITNLTAMGFTVIWNPPEKNPGIFIIYHVEIQSIGANYPESMDCSANGTTIFSNTTENEWYTFDSGLPYYNYEVRVTAENSAGNGSASNVTALTDASASKEPRDVTIDQELIADLNNITGNLTWKIPCRSNGPISTFYIGMVGYYTQNSSIQDARSFSVDATSSEEYYKVIEELMPASKYKISVRAVGYNETGIPSDYIFFTEDNVPGPPIIQNVTDYGPYNILVSWVEPERNAGEITNYTVEINSLGPLYEYDHVRCNLSNETFNTTVLDGNITSYNFTQGRPYYMYKISVTAFTSKGPGNASSILAKTKPYVPEKPMNFGFKLIDNTTGLLSWNTPCHLNGPITNFSVLITGTYTDNTTIVTKKNATVIYASVSSNYSYEVQLQEGHHYEANIWVVSDEFDGERTAANLTTPDGYPGAPGPLNFSEIGANSFTVSWDPPSIYAGSIQSYKIVVTPHGPMYSIRPGCPVNTTSYHHIVNGSDERSFSFREAYPYYNYSVSIQARTSRGFGNISQNFVITNQSVPDNVVLSQGPTVSDPTSEDYNAYADILFEVPCFLNGILTKFELDIFGSRPNFEDDRPAPLSNTTPSFRYWLKPEYNYTFTVTTYNEIFNNTSDSQVFTAPAGVPTFSIEATDFNVEKGTSSATITLKKEYFDESNGDIHYLSLILTDKNITGGHFERWNGEWPTISITETELYYQLTQDYWNPFTDSSNVTIHIGSNSIECESRIDCSKPLEENREYYLIIRLFTQDFYRNSPTIYFRTDDVSKVGLIVGVIFGLLIAAVIGLVGFFVWRKNLLKLPPIFYPRKSSCNHATQNTAVPIPKFPQYCKNLENNPEKLTEQYTLLTEKTKEAIRMHTTHYAELTENRRKNRYTNILPYDETRVKLLIDEDDEIGSDYINASYIKGYSGKVEYIATQGPLPTTSRDFWKMVIQENVSIIVMVTQFIEQNKEKCYRYFPNNHESMIVGEDMEVRCSMELHFGTYCVRTLQVRKDTTQVSVTHMQYLDWPDFNVPKGTETMLQFCCQLRDRLNIEGGCVIVHCSAGVGRTGTLIATDILLQNVNAGRNIDLFNTVLELRKQRTNMVQTQKQYMYIYNLIKDNLEQSQTPGFNENMEHVYENVSVLKIKQDDDNLIVKEKETESQF